jgi:WD40 repeat protein
MMAYRCDRCGRTWDDSLAAENDFRCSRRCGGSLVGPGPSPADAKQPGHLARLPSVLAIPLRDYLTEAHPVLRLHRLFDAGEILTRFLAVVALGELRRRAGGGPLPDDLLGVLRPQIERPTFGQWRTMLEALVRRLGPGEPLVVPELPGFVREQWLPRLAGGALPEESLVGLRNLLVHGGAMTRAAASEFLETWGPWLDGLPPQLAFLAEAEVFHHAGGALRRLAGPTAAGEERPVPTDLSLTPPSGGRVVLLRAGHALDLGPLCEYGRATAPTPRGPGRAAHDGPLVYVRAEADRLIYAALGVDLAHGERRDAVGPFRALFRLDERPAAETGVAEDFEAEVRRDAAALVGREREQAQLKQAVKEARTGVLWVAGPGGIGKSFLLAKVADDLGHAPPERLCRIAWRFQAGDGARCQRAAFFRHAVRCLGRWPALPTVGRISNPSGEEGRIGNPSYEKRPLAPTLAQGPDELYAQLGALLNEAAGLTAGDSRARPPRVLFTLDGLDEIERLDPDFAEVPFRLSRPNVVWLCAGRPERSLPRVFAPRRCTHVFAGGLPPMAEADIRSMLLDGTGSLKCDLLALDSEGEESGRVTNRAVSAVVERAGGLPLYVHHVAQDVLTGHCRFADLERRLPPGLAAYYDDLLGRLAVGDLQALLTPLAVTLAWARAPLDEETLHLLMVRRKVLAEGGEGRAMLRRALEAVGSLVRLAPVPGAARHGYELYHPIFREHVRTDAAMALGQQNELARQELCALAVGWAGVPDAHPARDYALRYGPRTLLEAGRREEAESLLTSPAFLEAKAEAGLVYDLAGDFAEAAEGPSSPVLRPLEEALRRDLPFLGRHPAALFQCLWNSCWWYDGPESAAHYDPPEGGWPPDGPPWERPGPRLSALMESWRQAKERDVPGFRWLRSLVPPALPLGTAQVALYREHGAWVTGVAFSPDGTCVAATGRDETIRVWHTPTGRQQACWSAHRLGGLALAYSPDGRRLASGGADGKVRLWDAVGGTALACCSGHEGEVESVGFFPDGRRVASGGLDGTVRVWDADTGGLLLRLPADERAVHAVAVSPDGRRVAAGGHDRLVRIWDAGGGPPLECRRQHEGRVRAVAFSPDGRRIASGGDGREVWLWDPDTGKLWERVSEAGWVRCLAFSPAGRRLVTGGMGDDLLIWDLSGRERPTRLQGHRGDVFGVAFSPDGRSLVSGGLDGTVRLWRAAGGEQPARRRDHVGGVIQVTFSPDGRLVSVGGMTDGTVRVRDAAGGREVLCLRGLDRVQCLALAPDGRRLATGGGDGIVTVWDVHSGARLASLTGHEGWVRCVAFSPDGRRLASGGGDRSVRLWDAAGGRMLACLRGHEEAVVGVAYAGDGTRLASWSQSPGGAIRLWKTRGNRELACLRGHRRGVEGVAFSPDGRHLASHGRDRLVRVWDVERGRELACLRGHEGDVEGLAWSADGRRLFSSASDGTVRVWDVASGSCTEVIPGRGDTRALAAGASRFPFRAVHRGREVVVEAAAAGEAVGWFPTAPASIVTHPAGRTWAGAADGHVYLFTLT